MKKKKKEEKEDFLAVIKLVSGEEIISTVTPCEEDDLNHLIERIKIYNEEKFNYEIVQIDLGEK